MNTFYFDDKTERIVEEKPANSYTEIKTSKSFEEFDLAFDEARAEGNSILDSIEWAK